MFSMGFALQLLATFLIGGLIGLASVRAFRSERLSFSLLCAWLLVAFQVGAAPLLSAALKGPAARLGVTQTGLLLGFMVASILGSLFQVSLDVSRVRRHLLRQVTTEREPQFVLDSIAMMAAPSGVPVDRRTIVVIPAFNEVASIRNIVERVIQAGYAVLVVDDGSTDGTANVAATAGAGILQHRFNAGPGAALRTGLTAAAELGFDFVVQCDADGQHRPEHIADLVEEALRGRADLVIGSRFAKSGSYSGSMGKLRWWASRFLARSASRATSAAITDATSGFRCFTTALAKQATHMGDHYLSDTYEFLVRIGRGGHLVTEVGVAMEARAGGEASSQGFRLVLLTIRTWVVTATRLVPPIHSGQSERQGSVS
jgi:Glycosyl transferase family 2